MASQQPAKADKILIIGAGCFGLSSAYHLLKSGYTNVVVVDQSDTLPAPNAASTDLNKIVRTSYSDIVYTKLAAEAIETWKDRDVWGGVYHECGVLLVGAPSSTSSESKYHVKALSNDLSLNLPITSLPTRESFEEEFGPQLCKLLGSTVIPPTSVAPTLSDGPTSQNRKNGLEEKLQGLNLESLQSQQPSTTTGAYIAHTAGWAAAANGIKTLMSHVSALGAEIRAGVKVTGFSYAESESTESREVRGVKVEGDSDIEADWIIVASGSWTASSFASSFPTSSSSELAKVGLGKKLLATGQCLATIQLSPSEAETYRNFPVILDWSSGFYVFPPNEDNVVKAAIHAAGYINPQSLSNTSDVISTPVTLDSEPNSSHLRIPAQASALLREHLRSVYPQLADKEWLGTRVCWYTDTPDGNWIIDYVPGSHNVLFATGGSGHAYKFLPIIGSIVQKRLEGTLEDELADKFSFTRDFSGKDLSREGQEPALLDFSSLSPV
ncbi:FAD dependent oxidoreductase [Sistotremastrum suecicum HHB10207 ss-3]|uniref:FAD dependent oxidoreductase n=1 Tax=Sistotremastrum suecicum HHB10207 ss-3 TaxID=1314776 RepID=A0A166E7J3_9AGAM|nr:FAD dependent oxidoreductase [Sistotremastrum suecicum HHB10207 ss-3]